MATLFKSIKGSEFRTTRLTAVGDSNLAGNVHGGVIMQEIEQSGFIAAARFCGTLVVSASMGRVNFITPFYIGELLVLSSRVVYASAHSVEVEVKVHAENVLTGEKRISNTAHVVYVVPRDKRDAFVMPRLIADTDEEREEMERGKKRYEERKRRWETGEELAASVWRKAQFGEESEAGPMSILTHVTLPHESSGYGKVIRGGVALKLIDNCAGIAAFRHARSNIVTASMEHTDFLSPVQVGDLLKLRARVTFTSSRSMEVTVIMEAENALSEAPRLVCSSVLVFVALDKDRKVTTVAQITPVSEHDKALWEKGKESYERRRREGAK